MVLRTTALTQDVNYTLTGNDVTDRAATPNPISANTQVAFSFSQSLIGATTTLGNYVWSVLDVGEPVYIDRGITYTEIPAGILGLDYLQMANDDKFSTGNPFITFDVTASATACTPLWWLFLLATPIGHRI